MQSFIDIVGFAAGLLTTIAFVPQVVKSWRTRDLSGISFRMYGLFTGGVALWLLYGIVTRIWPIIVTNAVTLALAATMLYLKLKVKVAVAGK